MSTSTIKMPYARKLWVANGTYLTRIGNIVTLNGFLSLPYTLPEEYRPKDYIFVPVVVSVSYNNKIPEYATIGTTGKVTYGDNGLTDHPIFISATWCIG